MVVDQQTVESAPAPRLPRAFRTPSARLLACAINARPSCRDLKPCDASDAPCQHTGYTGQLDV